MPLNHPHCHGQSDVGSVRQNNEDQFLIADLSKAMLVHQSTLMQEETRLFSDVEGQLLVVADGMGGHASGERASELTTRTISDYVLRTMPWFMRLQHEPEENLQDLLQSAVVACERVVDDEASNDPSEAGMGTTLTMAYVIWPRMYVVHVGDSRCYIFRGGFLEQVTRDHTMLRELEDSGHTLNADQRRHFGRVLVNAIGLGVEALRPEVYRVDLQENDLVLMCTDGLTDMLDHTALSEIVRRHSQDEQACSQALIDAANNNGGRDNITVIVSQYPKPKDASSAFETELTSSMADTAEFPAIPGAPD